MPEENSPKIGQIEHPRSLPSSEMGLGLSERVKAFINRVCKLAVRPFQKQFKELG
jgi:hypothetical protein